MVNPPVKNKPNRPPVQITRKGVSPEWANLPRRKCDDCGKSYKPGRPLMEGQRGFCTPNCRKSYHKHGGAYRKLRTEIEKLIEKRFRGLIQVEIRECEVRVSKTLEARCISLFMPKQ
jgi:hypothetical protein